MRKPRLESTLRVIGFFILPITVLCFLLFLLCAMIGQAILAGIAVAVAIYFIRGAPHLIRVLDNDFVNVSSRYEEGRAFIQRGGLRYKSIIGVVNFTMPFATLRATKEAIIISVSTFGLFPRTFSFPRSSVRRLRWRRIFFSLGIQVEHDLSSCPSYIIFWVSNRKALIQGLRDFGYEVSDT